MPVRFVDLHTHTTASDGTDSPAEVVRKAARLGLAAVAITDHDTLSGLDEAEAAGEKYDIEVIRGCELSTQGEYGEVHLLGLWIPRECGPLQRELSRLRECRGTRNRRMLDKLHELGVDISLDAVLAQAGGESVGRPHIARAMLAAGYVSSIAEAFARYLAEGAAAYVPREIPGIVEGVRLLAGAGALVSLAHPRLIHCPEGWYDTVLPAMKAAGLDAIEAYHSEHSARDERFCVELAHRYDLGLSGGSDYHGTTKPHVSLGRGKGGLRVAEGFLENLRKRRRMI